MMRAWLVSLALALVACGQPHVEAEVEFATLSGLVLDAATGEGLGGVLVTTEPPGAYGTTNASGEYVVAAALQPGGAYRLRLERDGYVSHVVPGVQVNASAPTAITDVVLQRAGAVLRVGVDHAVVPDSVTGVPISLHNDGNKRLPLTYRISSTAPWLIVEPARGEVVGDSAWVTLRGDGLQLGENWGVYSTSLVITSNGGNATLPVTLTHAPQTSGQLQQASGVIDLGAVDRLASVRLENPGGAAVAWEVASAPAFLTPSAQAGTVPAADFLVLDLALERQSLAPGDYTATVLLTTDSEVTPFVGVQVSFEVRASLGAHLSVDQLDFGSEQRSLAFTLGNRGNGQLNYNIAWPYPGETRDFGGCQASPRVHTAPFVGQLGAGAQATILVQVDRSAQLPGDYVRRLEVETWTADASETRFVEVLYRVGRLERFTPTVTRSALDLRDSRSRISLSSTGAPGVGPCDVQSNVSVRWLLQPQEPWLQVSQTTGRIDPLRLDQGILVLGASAITTVDIVIDAEALPAQAATTHGTLASHWCFVPAGQADCDPLAEGAQRQDLAVSFTVPGARTELVLEQQRLQGAQVHDLDPFRGRLLLQTPQAWFEYDVRLDTVFEVEAPGGTHFNYVSGAFENPTVGAPGLGTWPAMAATYDTKRNAFVLLGAGSIGGSTTYANDLLRKPVGGDWVRIGHNLLDNAPLRGDLEYDVNQDRYLIVTEDRYVHSIDAETLEVAQERFLGDSEVALAVWGSLVHDPGFNTTYVNGLINDGGTTIGDPWEIYLLFNNDNRPSPVPQIQLLDGKPQVPTLTTDGRYDPLRDRVLWVSGGKVYQQLHSRLPVLPADLEISASLLDLDSGSGSLTVENTVDSVGVFRIGGLPAWLTATPSAGQLLGADAVEVEFVVDLESLGVGEHQATLSVHGLDGQTLPLLVEVTKL